MTLTRTHWLLITLVGLLVWFVGWFAMVPPLAIVGLFAVVVGAAGALLGHRA